MSSDQKFVFLCIKCTKGHTESAVNHHYTPIEGGLQLDYHCFTCGTHETKRIYYMKDVLPKDAWEFRKSVKGRKVYWGKKPKAN